MQNVMPEINDMFRYVMHKRIEARRSIVNSRLESEKRRVSEFATILQIEKQMQRALLVGINRRPLRLLLISDRVCLRYQVPDVEMVSQMNKWQEPACQKPRMSRYDRKRW